MSKDRALYVKRFQPWWKWPVAHRWGIAERYFYGEDANAIATEYGHDPYTVRGWLRALGIYEPKRRWHKQHEQALRHKALREAVDARAIKCVNFHPVKTKKQPTEAIRRLASCLLVALNSTQGRKLTIHQIGLVIDAARWWGGTESWDAREGAAASEAVCD